MVQLTLLHSLQHMSAVICTPAANSLSGLLCFESHQKNSENPCCIPSKQLRLPNKSFELILADGCLAILPPAQRAAANS